MNRILLASSAVILGAGVVALASPAQADEPTCTESNGVTFCSQNNTKELPNGDFVTVQKATADMTGFSSKSQGVMRFTSDQQPLLIATRQVGTVGDCVYRNQYVLAGGEIRRNVVDTEC